MKRIFLGSPTASADVQKLHSLLDEALGLLSGVQQPGHPETAEAAAREDVERLALERRIEARARDIYTRLVGRFP